MCGIAGFAAGYGPEVLEGMLDRLTHRGPDDRGSCSPGSGIRLGMTRLAIIDLKTGRQPMTDPSSGVTVVFNGEIFNYLELRESFERSGRNFLTRSDTETILHAYAADGDDFPHRLNGMFAAAVWDSRQKRLILTRDRFGVKPLFYSVHEDGVIFASEIKAFRAVPGFSWQLDREALSLFLSLRNIPAPKTAYSAIRALEPGHQLIWENGKVRIRRWYQLKVAPSGPTENEDVLADKLEALIQDSVRVRMRSDVAFGAYLSGGIDSSLITGMMSAVSTKPIKTYSLTYADMPAHKNDARYARMIAEKYGTDHTEWVMSWQDLKHELGDVFRQLDQPFGGVLSSYWLSRRMASEIKVALSGDGADEVFGSYGHHRLVAPLEALRDKRSRGLVPSEADYGSFRERKGFLESLEGLEPWEWRLSYAAFADGERKRLLTEKGREYFGPMTGSSVLKEAYAESAGCDQPLTRMLALDVRTLLPNEILYFNDMLSMAHSMEVRTPFLDYRIVEYGFGLPDRFKIRGNTLKYLLRKVAARHLPAEIIDRPKEGFVLPANTWMRGPMRPDLAERMERLAESGHFNRDYISELLRVFDAGDDSVAFKLWTLFAFQSWMDEAL